jgi:hypothetical protein
MELPINCDRKCGDARGFVLPADESIVRKNRWISLADDFLNNSRIF